METPESSALSLPDLESVGELVVGRLRAVQDRDWTRKVRGLEWTCWQTADHVATVVLTFAARIAVRTVDPFPMARCSDPDRSVPEVVDLIAAATRLLALGLADLPLGTRVFHPAGLADVEGYVAMACDELLVHAAEITAAVGDPFRPPDAIALRVARRLFPWAPGGFSGWDTLRWANDRAGLGDHPSPGPTWVWYCRPLVEWDGTVPEWDPIAGQLRGQSER